MKQAIPSDVKNWQDSIGKLNAQAMSCLYSENAVLIPTFGDIKQGRSEISKYFVKFLDKKNLSCKIFSMATQNLPEGFKVSNGYYYFLFTGDDGKNEKVLARFTYVTDSKGFIHTHHSSEEPDKD